MSRIGKRPVVLPENVTVEIRAGIAVITGPKGKLEVPVAPDVEVVQEGDKLEVRILSETRQSGAMHGLTRSLVANAVDGVSKGFEKRLEVYGTGYRADLEGKSLRLAIGLSHPVLVAPPSEIEFIVESPSATNDNPARVLIRGIDKAHVGQTAATIRALKPPEPYKGKGIRLSGEVVRRKAGKAAA